MQVTSEDLMTRAMKIVIAAFVIAGISLAVGVGWIAWKVLNLIG